MGNTWHCLSCGARYGEHFPFCSRCWRSGGIVPSPERNRAAVDYRPGVASAREIARMSWKQVEHPGAYDALVLGAGSLVEVFGGPGHGKSTFAARLLDAVRGPVVCVAGEEGISPSLSARLLRCNIRRDDFTIVTRATVDHVVALATERGAVGLAVDSVSECAYSATELRHVIEVVPTLDVLLAVMQVTKAGLPAGAMALQHEADVIVSVEAMRFCLTKSRYQDLATVGGDVLPQRRETEAA